MDADRLAEDQLFEIQESTRSLSATPLNLRFVSRADPYNDPSSSTKEKGKVSCFSSATPDVHEASAQKCGQNEILWHNLEMQLMQATMQDKALSELYLQRTIHKQSHMHTRRYERKKSGSWSSLVFLLLGILPASAVIFALVCTIYHIDIEHPQ
jgi:hypothetical protein